MKTMVVGACTLALMAAGLAEAQVIRGKLSVAPAAKSKAIETMHLGSGAAASTIILSPVSLTAKSRDADEARDEKRERIGLRRDVAVEKRTTEGPRTLQWAPASGGHAARLALSSPDAAGLRLALSVRDLPAGTELRFIGNASPRVAGPVSGDEALAHARSHGAYWTPVTEGDSQAVEVWIPAAADPARVRVTIETASHLDRPPSQFSKAGGIGAAQSCNQDVVCAAPGNEAVAQAARSVAKMVFTENGSTYLCSATLISDGNPASQVPYLYTAAHCIGSQAAAATLNTYWFFDASSCGAKGSQSYRQLTGGAKLLYSNAASDAALLKLADAAPDGAWFAGWDASPLQAGAALLALHHPAGDLKKLTTGQSLAATSNASGSSYSTAAWLSGSTEGGSSGSGLFTLDGNEYVLRGGLRGGSASCDTTGRVDNPSNRDYYSRIDLEASMLRGWLDAAATPDDDYTGMWFNPAEPGWGVSIMQNNVNRVFVAWYTYDASGSPTWLVMPEGEWVSGKAIEGKLYRASGTAFDRAYEPAKFGVASVGTVRLDFGAGDTATLTVRMSGTTLTKALRRQPL